MKAKEAYKRSETATRNTEAAKEELRQIYREIEVSADRGEHSITALSSPVSRAQLLDDGYLVRQAAFYEKAPANERYAIDIRWED